MMFVWIGAAVDIPRRVHKYLSTLGPKLYFLRLPKEFYKNPEDEYLKQIKGIDFAKKVRAIDQTLFDYLKWFELCPYTATDQSSGLPKIEWNTDDKDDEESVRYLIRLGRLLGHLRASVPTWDTSHSQGSEYAYSMATIEEPTRAITQLSNLARGHALSQGRNFITKEDISIVVKVVLSTASIERVAVFDLLLAHGGKLQTPIIADSLNISVPTALRTMTEFKAIGLVDMDKAGESSHVTEIKLKPDFGWFLTSEFEKLRDGYRPQEDDAKTENRDDPEDDSKGSINDSNSDNYDSKICNEPRQKVDGPITEDSSSDTEGNDNNNTFQFSQTVELSPTGDSETIRTGKVIVRCSKGSDMWCCTGEKCRVKGDIYALRAHIC